MPTRAEILYALTEGHEKTLAYYQSLTSEEMERRCTESEVAGSERWAPKDHLAHLVLIERSFQRMIKHALRGDADPVGFSRTGAKNREEIRAWVHQNNQKYMDAHHEDSIENLLLALAATRKETFVLLDQLTDEQLAISLPGAPWADGTIGGIIITSAQHERMHQKWVDEGLQQKIL